MEEAANALAEDTLPRAVPAPDVLPEEAISEEALMAVLQATFGFSAFRRLQLLVIQSVLRSQTTFAIMPTGDCSFVTIKLLNALCASCQTCQSYP